MAKKTDNLAEADWFEKRSLSKSQIRRVDHLAAVFADFIDEGSNTAKTKQYYINGLRLLKAHSVWSERLIDLTNKSIGATTLPGGPSNKNCALKTLRRMLSLARKWKIIKTQPEIKILRENMRSRQIT